MKMKLKWILPILILCLLSTIALADINVRLNPPMNTLSNTTWKTTSSITYGFNVTGNVSVFDDCYLYTDDNHTGTSVWYQVETMSNVANNTNYNFTTRVVSDTPYNTWYVWNVLCNDSQAVSSPDLIGNFSALGNYTFYVDTVNPVIGLYYTYPQWINTGNVSLRLNVTDTNPAQCYLHTTLNLTSNSSGTFNTINASFNTTYANATTFIFAPGLFHDTIHYKFLDNNTGSYYFNVTCNDSAGRKSETGIKYVFVDTVAPSDFDFNLTLFRTNNRALFNATTATDYEPMIGWNLSNELNFSRYEIFFYLTDWGTTTGAVALNISNKSQPSVNISTLAGDSVYWINITAFDVAGNQKQMNTVKWKYTTSSTNRVLKAGWNIIGNMGNIFNLNSLLNWTGATTVSAWNSTHQFTSYVSGGTGGDYNVANSTAAFVYLSSDVNFTDMVWNTSVFDKVGNLPVNVSNSSNSNWNIVINSNYTDDITIATIDSQLNTGSLIYKNNYSNVTYFAVFNNSASVGAKHVPYVANWSLYNGTTLKPGMAVWMYAGKINIDGQMFFWGLLK